jgi:hypothetical protein
VNEGNGGTFFKSTDGITWKQQPNIYSSTESLRFNSIATDGSLVIVTGEYPDDIENLVFVNKF